MTQVRPARGADALEEVEVAKREADKIQDQFAIAKQQREKAYAGVEEARKEKEEFERRSTDLDSGGANSNRLSVSLSVLYSEPQNSGGAKAPSDPL